MEKDLMDLVKEEKENEQESIHVNREVEFLSNNFELIYETIQEQYGVNISGIELDKGIQSGSKWYYPIFTGEEDNEQDGYLWISGHSFGYVKEIDLQ